MMANHRYRFQLPDGQVFEGTDLRRIRRVHPSARIVARIDFNDLGEGVVVPFRDDDAGHNAPAESAAAVPSNPKAKKEPKR